MRHVATLRIGPIGFRIGSDWRGPVDQLRDLYRDYPRPEAGIADFNVRLFAARPWRRFVRPSVMIGGDFTIPDAAPLPLDQGLLAAEMGMNLQMALAQRRYLLLHASAVERDGRALLMTGESGAGKSTLAALLMTRGWTNWSIPDWSNAWTNRREARRDAAHRTHRLSHRQRLARPGRPVA